MKYYLKEVETIVNRYEIDAKNKKEAMDIYENETLTPYSTERENVCIEAITTK